MSTNKKPAAKRRSSISFNAREIATPPTKIRLFVNEPHRENASTETNLVFSTNDTGAINTAHHTGEKPAVLADTNNSVLAAPVYELIPIVFPLEIKRKEVRLSLSTLTTISVHDKDKELVLLKIPAKYRGMDVICTTSIVRGSNLLTVKQNQHIGSMSEELSPCRYMGTLLGGFKAYACELKLDLKTLYGDNMKDEDSQAVPPLHLFVMKHYQNGTLGQYLNDRKKKNKRMEPFYVLQMAICLFSMLVDAHTLNIGLVDVSLDSLYVATDGGLYFSGYRSCLALSDEFNDTVYETKDNSDEYYAWINPSKINCPESKRLKTRYLRETDIFQASVILLKIIQKLESQVEDLVRIDRKAKKVVLLKQELDYSCFKLIPLIERGLRYDYSERLTAKDMLYGFETMRSKALAAYTLNSDHPLLNCS